MDDPRSFATNAVGGGIAVLALALVVGGGYLVFTGSPLLGILVVLLGVGVLVAAGTFLLVPAKLDEIEEGQRVSVREK